MVGSAGRLAVEVGGVVVKSSRAFQSATRSVDVDDKSWDALALVEGIYELVEGTYDFTAEGS